MRGGEPVKTNAGRRKNTVPSGRNAGAAVCPYGSRRNRAGGDATVFIIDKAACGLCTRLINFGGNEGEMRKRDGPPGFSEDGRRKAVCFRAECFETGASRPHRSAAKTHALSAEVFRKAVSNAEPTNRQWGFICHAEKHFLPGKEMSAGADNGR